MTLSHLFPFLKKRMWVELTLLVLQKKGLTVGRDVYATVVTKVATDNAETRWSQQGKNRAGIHSRVRLQSTSLLN
jgi:hypothetical protein